ncbi:hypothetical protein PYW07_014988 [Mythimna separata]|uniref:Uncharacterized protein n=1 Tax=Mythimna separata TaxID=271217 RepID=A0AAD7YXQ0_MYTSE|nr:hypothetical protein PYW07_014988 [Mythimna separata]
MLTNFAKYGNPTPNDLPLKWVPHSKDQLNFLYFGDELRMGDNKAETPVRGLVTELQSEESADVQLSMPPPLPSSAPVTPVGTTQLGRSASPSSAAAPLHEFPQDVGSALKLVVEELRALRLEVLEVRRDMAELKASSESCHVRMDGIESRLEVLEKRQCEGCAPSADSYLAPLV